MTLSFKLAGLRSAPEITSHFCAKLTIGKTRSDLMQRRWDVFSGVILSLILANTTVYALNPVPGWYAGIILGASYIPTLNLTVPASLSSTNEITGSLSHNVLGNIGGQMGYRCNNFRLEIEGLYNNNPLDVLKIGGVTINSPSTSSGLRLQGDTNIGAGFANGYYDFFSPDGSSNLVPYIGAGAGYAYVKSQIQFYNNDILVSSGDLSNSTSGIVGQAIIGMSYFLDDFTTFGLDFRYFTSAKTQEVTNSRIQFYSINAIVSGAFDFG